MFGFARRIKLKIQVKLELSRFTPAEMDCERLEAVLEAVFDMEVFTLVALLERDFPDLLA